MNRHVDFAPITAIPRRTQSAKEGLTHLSQAHMLSVLSFRWRHLADLCIFLKNNRNMTTALQSFLRCAGTSLAITVFCRQAWSQQSAVLDAFTVTPLNTAVWQVLAPLSDSRMIAADGNAVFFQRGVLVTKANMPSAIEINGRFSFVGGTYDIFEVKVRTDGSLLPPYYQFQNGVTVGLGRRGGDDGNQTGQRNVSINDGVASVIGNFTFATNVYYDFRIVDDGSTVSLFLGGAAAPILTLNSTVRSGNKVGMENRGFVPWWPLYDNQVKLDSISISALVPPVITAQPTPKAISVGQSATFSVTATAGGNLSYQWRKDGINLGTATNATLNIASAQPSDIGDYSVAVSAAGGGSVTSLNAALTIEGVNSGIWRDLIAQYLFTGNAKDATSTHLDFQAVPAFTSDRFGSNLSAAQFSGAPPLTTASIPLGQSGFSVSFWLRLTKSPSIGGERLVMHGSWNTGSGLFSVAVWGDGRLAMSVADAVGSPANSVDSRTGTLSTNIWYHIVAYADGSTTNLAVNGVRLATSPVTLGVKNAPFFVGGDTPNYGFLSGIIDDVRLYNRALSTSEIADLYASEAPPFGPAIIIAPSAQAAIEGQRTSLTVAATGLPPLFYQWAKNGVPISGATSASIYFEAVRMSDAGSYAVTISNAVGVTTSAAVALTVRSANPGRLSNLSIRTSAGAGNGTLIVGFSLGGSATTGTTPLLTRACGPALSQFGISGTLPDPFLSLYDGGRLIGSSDDWGGANAISSAADSVGAFSFSPASKDAAMVSTLPASGYTAQTFDTGGASGVALVEVYDTSPAFSYTKPRLINLSARANASSGGSTMIAGFFVKGETPVTVLLRGVGPALTQFGVSGVLANPRLTLYRDSTLVGINDNWGDLGASTIAATAAAVGAFALPAGSLDAAILATLQPGAYTVQVLGADNTAGIALIEVYEVP